MPSELTAKFDAQANRHGQRLAVETRNHSLTYLELDRLSNRVAHALLNRCGQDTGHSVAALMEEDCFLYAAFLGALKAGKRFVPIDPDLPPARALRMLQDSDAVLLLTDFTELELSKHHGEPSLPVLRLPELPPDLPDQSPRLDVPGSAHTWILYTSGTTGAPKGVLQNHRNLARYVEIYDSGFRLNPENRVATTFSPCTNGGLHDFLLAVCFGASLHFWKARRHGAAGLAPWIQSRSATMLSCAPTIFREMAASLAGAETLPSVRILRLWAEPSYRRDLDAFSLRFPNARLVNRLGSSETGPACWQFFQPGEQIDGVLLPVGRPTPGHQVLLLDDDGRPVRPGETGEVVIRSEFLSPGYWRLPEKTSQVFRQDPDDAACRRYHTGDLGRLLDDDNLVHMGRKDFQVKISGYRVETGEIEQALLLHPSLRDATVVARPTAAGGQRLVAYVIPRSNPPPTISSIRRQLAACLPGYMIPSAFVMLDSFPLALNGKIARAALPEPGTHRPCLDSSYSPPVTETEKALAAIWSGILQIDEIGADDPFLDLGGTSLGAMQVIAAVIRRFGVELRVQSLLETATIRQLAPLVDQALAAGGDINALLDEIESLSDTEALHRLKDPEQPLP